MVQNNTVLSGNVPQSGQYPVGVFPWCNTKKHTLETRAPVGRINAPRTRLKPSFWAMLSTVFSVRGGSRRKGNTKAACGVALRRGWAMFCTPESLLECSLCPFWKYITNKKVNDRINRRMAMHETRANMQIRKQTNQACINGERGALAERQLPMVADETSTSRVSHP